MNLYLPSFILLAIFINISGYSQQSSIYNEVKEYYGVDPSLVNGRYFENTYFRDKGHPFFLTNEFSDGTILLNGKQYYNQKIMYNIYDQNIVLQSNNGNNSVAYLPPLDFVNEFTIGSKLFRKYIMPDKSIALYEVVYDGNIKCLNYWSKNRSESDHASIMAHTYSDEKRKSYIYINNIHYKYNSTATFVKIFPKEQRKAIKTFIKSNSINVKFSQNDKMALLLSYCETLINNRVSSYPQSK